jgi:predicted phosphodiesterase
MIDTSKSLLVFGGPYSNVRAVAALRVEAERRRIAATNVICTGDVVAYCAEPEETVAAIRDWGCAVVAGNCETQLADDAADCGCGFEDGTVCNVLAKDWYSYARQRVSAGSCAWMATLPQSITVEVGGLGVHVLHGGTMANNRFVFGSDTAAIDEELARADADIVVGGHAGLPFVVKRPGGVWFNPGVIGMPANDGTFEVWYGLVEPGRDGVTLSTHRLRYNHGGAAAAMRRAGYADPYAAALETGLWPSLDVLPPAERAATGRALPALSITVSARCRRGPASAVPD